MFTNQPSQQQTSFISESSCEVYVWKTGKNPNATLFPSTSNTKSENCTLLEVGIPVENVTCGDAHMIFKSEGKLYAMGENANGQLGVSKRNVRSSTTPLLISSLSTFRVLKVACGSRHTVVLVEPGEIYSWGYGGDGQLGLKTDLTQFSPQLVRLEKNEAFSRAEENIPAADVSCGANHTGVISRFGELYTFGAGELGQLGTGKKANEFVPAKVKLPPQEKAEKVSCGKYYTLVLTARGSVYGFGLNSQGQLGLGHRKNCDTPHKISFLDKYKLSKVQAGSHSVGLTFMGEMYVWGPCVLGECLVPQRVCKNIETSIADVQIGSNFTSMLDFKGYLWGLGAQRRGEVGIESIEARAQACPVAFLNHLKIKTVACTRDAAVIIGEKRSQFNNTSLLNKTRSLSPYKTEEDSIRVGRKYVDMKNSIRGRMYSPQVRPGGFKSLSSMLQAWKQGDMSSFIGESNPTEMSFAKNILPGVISPTNVKVKTDCSSEVEFRVREFSQEQERRTETGETGKSVFRVRDFDLEQERTLESHEVNKNVFKVPAFNLEQRKETDPTKIRRNTPLVVSAESEGSEGWPTIENLETEPIKSVPKLEDEREISLINRNTPDVPAFEESSHEVENSKESIDQALSAHSHRRDTHSSRMKRQISLEDVINQVESIDLQEEVESFNNPSHSHHENDRNQDNEGDDIEVKQEDDHESGPDGDIHDRRLYDNESRMGDLILDIKNLKAKNNLLESQIEQKAREIALLESKVGQPDDDEAISSEEGINENKQSLALSQPISGKSLRLDSPPREIVYPENRFFEESPKSTIKDKDSALMESLILENKNLKGLVSYLVKAKGIKSDDHFLSSSDKIKRDFHSQENPDLGSDSEVLDNTLNLRNSFTSWQPQSKKEESPKEKSTVRSSAPIEEFIIAPPPGYERKRPTSPSRSKASREDREGSVKGSSQVLKVRKVTKSASMIAGLDSDREQRKSRGLRKTNSVVFADKSNDSIISAKMLKEGQKVVKKIVKKRSLERSQSVLRDSSTERKAIFSRSIKKSNSLIANESSVESILRPKNVKTVKKNSVSPKKKKLKKAKTQSFIVSAPGTDRKLAPKPKLKKTNSVILNDKSIDNAQALKSLKKLAAKIFDKRSSQRSQSLIRDASLDRNQEVTRKLRKTNSLVPSEKSLPNSPKKDKSPKKFLLKSPKKTLKRSQSKQPSLMNIDSGRKDLVQKIRKTNSLILSDSSFASSPKKIKIVKKSTPKDSKRSVQKSKEPSLMNIDSSPKSVVHKVKKSHSLAPSDRSLSMSPKRDSSPKKFEVTDRKRALVRSQSRESSILSIESGRTGLVNKLRKANSMILNDSSLVSSPKKVKTTKKSTTKSPKKTEQKAKSKKSSLAYLDLHEKQEIPRKLKKSNSLAPNEGSIAPAPKQDNSPKRGKSPKKFEVTDRKRALVRSQSRESSILSIESGRTGLVNKLRKANSMILNDSSLVSSPKKVKITKKSTTKSPKKTQQKAKSKGSSLAYLDLHERQEVPRKLKKSNSLAPNEGSISPTPKQDNSPKKDKSPKKFLLKTPKKPLVRSQSRESSMLLSIDSGRKGFANNLRKTHSLILNDSSIVSSPKKIKITEKSKVKKTKKTSNNSQIKGSSLLNLDSQRKQSEARQLRKTNSLIISNNTSFASSPKNSKKIVSKSAKKPTQKSPAKELSMTNLDKKEVLRKLEKASSLVVTDRTFIVGNPNGNSSPKRSRPLSPVKLSQKPKTPSLLNIDLERKSPRKLRKTHSLVINDKSFESVNSTKTFKSFKKIVAKISKNQSPNVSQTQESILRESYSDRQKEVSRIIQKANSLIVTNRPFIVTNPDGPKTPKKIVLKSKKNTDRSQSREHSLANIESERKPKVTKKLRKTHSLVLNDSSDSIHSTRSLQSLKKLTAKIPKNTSPERSQSTITDINADQGKKLKKAISLVPTSLSIDSSPTLKTPKKLKTKKKTQRSQSREPSLLNLDGERATDRFKTLRKSHSLMVDDRSLDSIRRPQSVASVKRFKTPKKGGKKSGQPSLMNLDSETKLKNTKKLRKAKSMMTNDKSSDSLLQSPKKGKSGKKSKSKNPKKAPMRSFTQTVTGGSIQTISDRSPLRKKSPSKIPKIPKRPAKPVGNLKETAPVKETKSVVTGKKALMVTFQKNTGKEVKETPKKAPKILRMDTNKSISSSTSKKTPKIPSRTRVDSPPTFRDNSQILTNSMTATPIYLKKRNDDLTDSSFQDLSLLRGKSGGSTGFESPNFLSPNFLAKPLDETLEFSSMRLTKQEPNLSGIKQTPSNSFIAAPQKPKPQILSASKVSAKAVANTKSAEKKTIKTKNILLSAKKGSTSDLYDQVSDKVKQKNQKANH